MPLTRTEGTEGNQPRAGPVYDDYHSGHRRHFADIGLSGGADVLGRCGSVVDAAIAANAVLAVVEPRMNGIGGGLFALAWIVNAGKLQGLNAHG